jgi:hypothetical protein
VERTRRPEHLVLQLPRLAPQERRGACKHGIACYVLWKAGKGPGRGMPGLLGAT